MLLFFFSVAGEIVAHSRQRTVELSDLFHFESFFYFDPSDDRKIWLTKIQAWIAVSDVKLLFLLTISTLSFFLLTFQSLQKNAGHRKRMLNVRNDFFYS